jgi:hypothetical protein
VSTRTAQAGIFSRRMLAVAAVATIALAFGYLVHPMQVGATTQVDNHQLDNGKTISSIGFTEDPGVCDAGGFTSGVTWHFVLNKYESGDAELFGSFQSAGSFGPIDSSKRAGSVLMFYVNTPTDDTLLTNWAILDTADADAQLQLSSVCHGGEQQSVAESASAEQSVEASAASVAASASGEQSVEAGTGTPAASQANTAGLFDGNSPLPTILFSLILLASLGTLAYANVKSVRNRI